MYMCTYSNIIHVHKYPIPHIEGEYIKTSNTRNTKKHIIFVVKLKKYVMLVLFKKSNLMHYPLCFMTTTDFSPNRIDKYNCSSSLFRNSIMFNNKLCDYYNTICNVSRAKLFIILTYGYNNNMLNSRG